jgi:hypothetical protein
LSAVFVALTAPAAHAQFGGQTPFSDPATGEVYHIEAAGGFWNPTPNIIISSEALGIVGSDIDAVLDLGIEQKRFTDLRLVLRPGRKHKFRLHYIPMTYVAERTLVRDVVFNGVRYRVGLPVATTFDWTALKIGYEYDFLYRDRWYAGFFTDVKFTDIQVNLESPLAADFAHAAAPVPTIGGVGRVYIVPNISATFELTGIKIPESFDEQYRAHYWDFDLYGTVNFNDYVGAQLGYRSFDVGYLVEEDSGTLKMKGWYFGGVVRY